MSCQPEKKKPGYVWFLITTPADSVVRTYRAGQTHTYGFEFEIHQRLQRDARQAQKNALRFAVLR